MTALGFALAAIAILVAAIVLVIVHVAAGRANLDARRVTRVAALAIGGWLALTAIASAAGVFRIDGNGPPRVMVLPVTMIVACIALLATRTGRTIAAAVPPAAIIALQTFRLFVELVLWGLYVTGDVPIQMTFGGRNFDVLVGLTAIPVAIYVARNGRGALAAAWHVASLVLLVNIVATAVTSTPGPLRVFMAEPALRIVGEFPFVWLPAFLVPVALISHVVGLRRNT